MMQKDRDARPSGWGVLAGQLEARLAGQPAPALGRPHRRALWLGLGAAGLAVALVVGVLVGQSLRGARRGPRASRRDATPVAERTAPSAALAAPAAASLTEAMDRVADLILARDLKEANSVWRREQTRLAGTIDAGRLRDLDAVVTGAIRVPERILESFRDEVGKEITVTLREGSLTLTITEVKEHEILGMTRRGDQVQPATFSIRELELDEQLRRLALRPDPCPELTRGIVFLGGGRVALAVASFRRAAHPLGDAFIVALERRRLQGPETAPPRRPLRDALPRLRPAAPGTPPK